MSRTDFTDASAGIHSINHFALSMPNLPTSAEFLRTFGLRVQETPDQLHVRTDFDDHVWAVIVHGQRKQLAYVSVACYAEDFRTLVGQIAAAGGAVAQPHPAGERDGHWFRDPHGMLMHLKVGAKTSPDHKSSMPDLNVAANERGAPLRSLSAKVAPTRMSHLALFTPNVTDSVDFHTRALGLRLSDRSGDIVAFAHARHGSDHHLLAFANGGGIGLHHSSWDVPTIDDVGRGNSQMRAAGHHNHWGPGRHVLGSNYFNYVEDPFHQWWEHSCHIDFIEKGIRWEPTNSPPQDALYLWGPDLPPGMVDNPEL